VGNELKQVIILRKDLNMRKGKMIAQGAHASMAVLTNQMEDVSKDPNVHILELVLSKDEHEWTTEHFAKIALGVDSDIELVAVYEAAVAAQLPCVLITDEGLTEFHGVRTNTAVAIGPADRTEIDKITGHLKLL
jgi:PTH2 family peptidyl-tRNA hydrolase